MNQPDDNPLSVQPLSPEVCASSQLDPIDMQAVWDAGFKSIVNNRPDFEGGPAQPTSAAIAEAAQTVGLEYAFLPVNGAHQSPEEIARFRELVSRLPKPVLAFCRSGARSTRLYQAAMALGAD